MEHYLTLFIFVDFLLLSTTGQRYGDDIITDLVNRLDAQQRQIDELKQQNQQHLQKSDAQQLQIDVLQETVKTQQTKILRLTQEKDVKRSIQPNVQISDDQYKEENNTYEGNKRQLPTEGTVAFTAVLTHALASLGVDQNLIFDRIYTNIGGGYNNHHGVFTAPVSGIYVFYTNILTHPHNLAFCRIAVNGVNKADVYVTGGSVHNSGSQMIVVQLNKGDDVAVQNKQQTDLIYSDANIYTTFSGFLLQDLTEFNGGILGK